MSADVDPRDAQPDPSTTSMLERLGPRAVRRMTPRAGVALAGAGSVIAVGGAVGIGGDQLLGDDGDVQRLPGIFIALALIVVGYAVLARVQTGPLASAGATASALGVPVLLFFLTFDTDELPNIDAILLVSTGAWLAGYFIGPSMGRLLYLALALAGAWLFVLNLIEPIEEVGPFGLFSARAGSFESVEGYSYDEDLSYDGDLSGEAESPILPGDSPFDDDFGSDFDEPDLTNLAVVSLLFGAAYAFASFALSRRGFDGVGTALIAVSIVCLAAGVQLFSPELEQVGTGFLAIAVGVALALVGAAAGRRLTAWAGALGVGLGTIAVVQKGVADSSVTGQSLAFLLVGIAVVCAGHLLGAALDEPDEEDETRTRVTPRRRSDPPMFDEVEA